MSAFIEFGIILTILPTILIFLIVLYCSIKYFKKNIKSEKDKNVISTMLSFTIIITNIIIFIYFNYFLVSLFWDELRLFIFVLLIFIAIFIAIFNLFVIISTLSLSIEKKKLAGIIGIIHGVLSCLSIIGIPVGLLEIIMVYIYLKVFQKN